MFCVFGWAYDFHIDILLRFKSKWIWYAQQDLYQWYVAQNRIYYTISNIQHPTSKHQKHWIINFMTFQLNLLLFFCFRFFSFVLQFEFQCRFHWNWTPDFVAYWFYSTSQKEKENENEKFWISQWKHLSFSHKATMNLLRKEMVFSSKHKHLCVCASICSLFIFYLIRWLKYQNIFSQNWSSDLGEVWNRSWTLWNAFALGSLQCTL